MAKSKITFPAFYGNSSSKVEVIKTLRVLFGVDLKGAKDASETPGEQIFELLPNIKHYGSDVPAVLEDQYSILRKNGCKVDTLDIKQDILNLSIKAIHSGNIEMAIGLLSLLCNSSNKH